MSAQTYQSALDRVVQSVEDDAIEYGDAAQEVILTSFGMNITESWSQQKIGLRFTDLQIPQGAQIKEAYVQFICKDADNSNGPSNLLWNAELSSNAAPFAASASNISNRPLTNATVNWQPAEWRWQEYGGPEAQSVNLASIFQEVITNTAWNSGNSIALIISGTGQRSAHNFFSGKPATLHLTFEAPVPNTPISNIFINEVCANGTNYPDETGDFEDWIELYNDNDFPVEVGGLYLSDKADELDRWQISAAAVIPAKGFLVIWADGNTERSGLHADFSLNKNGETLVLSQNINNTFTIIDSQTYEEVKFKTSFGRINEQVDNWKLFGEPTPAAPNGDGLEWLAKPTVNLEEGIYTGNVELVLSHPDPAAVIRFTFDGSDPSIFAPAYTAPIAFGQTRSLKARAFKDGAAPSEVIVKSYLFDAPNSLPVVMITGNPTDLFSDEFGILVAGNSTEEVFVCGQWQSANFLQDWERPVHLTFIENDGSLAFSVDAGMKVAGQCSRKYALKSLNINLRNNQYGNKDINYPLFEDRDRDNYSRLKLRNSGQDYRGIAMRDGVNQIILSSMTDLEYQAYRPTVVYINNEYWGILNWRERYAEKYFSDIELDGDEVDGDNIDLLKNQEFLREIKEGDDIHFQQMHDFILDNDMSIAANYEYILTQMDVNNFIDYWLSILYISNSDWPANNKQIWRPRKDDGKWRWVLIDTDNSTDMTGPDSDQGHRSDKLSKVLQDGVDGWPNDSKSTMIFRHLLTNSDFKNEFIQRGCTFTELIFDPARVLPMIENYKSAIADDIADHLTRWAFDNPDLQDKPDWEDNSGKFITFYQNRPPYFYGNLKDNFSLGDTIDITFNYDADTKGDVVIHWDQRAIPHNYVGTYFKDVPLRVTAVPMSGYEFSHWLETGVTEASIDYLPTASSSLTPIFEMGLMDATTTIAQDAIKIWPNPANQTITIEPRNTELSSYVIYNAAMQPVEFNTEAFADQRMVQVKNWPSGVYIIIAESRDGKKIVERFTKL